MPRPTTTLTPQQERTEKAERVRKVLNAALNSDGQNESDTDVSETDVSDSDKSDADDDEPWEWIYSGGAELEKEKAPETPCRRQQVRDAVKCQRGSKIGVRRRADGLECRIGDSVLLNAPGSKVPWVGMLISFVGRDEDGDECAEFMWFSDEKEIYNKQKKRTDFLPHELYITPGMDESPLDSIIGEATILSEKAFMARFPSGKIPRKSRDFGNTYLCRRGCHTGTTTYTDEFSWDDIAHGTHEEVLQLTERLESETKPRRKKRGPKRTREGSFVDDELAADEGFGTPRKKQKTSLISTPKKPRTPSKLLTPSHKRVIVKKPLEFTPLGTRLLDPDHVYSSPFQTARSKLHVAAVPTTLPCREDEFASVYSHLEAAIYEGTGACIYISGTPGTGKTATVREVVAQLNTSVMADELDDFIFVEINGMKVTDPHQSYSLLWEALKGDRVSPSHALDLLEREFNHPSPRRVPCVVLMDELDQLVTKNQSVMYNFFNWPGLRHSKLIVLAVANTMDLPERTLSNKISSRLGLTRITFPGYTHEQLMKIIQSRLEGVPGDIVDPDAVQFASRKVAAVSGDARRALDICRRAVELAEAESLFATPSTPSKSGRGEKASKSSGRVTIATIKRAINEATTSPLQQYLRGLPLSAKILLAALLARMRRTGIAESILGDVLDEARRMAKMDTGGNTEQFLLKEDLVSLKRKSLPAGSKQSGKTFRVLAMGLSAVDLMEAGIIGLETRKADRTGKIRLSIGEEDLKLAFKDDPEVKSLGFSA
ncbi:p-loop containing nucleoside triphosphate hydrolase [Venustampulla echinocandica]|uniref:Origin recognition complex subunit 1 n=1 Tax=Venustampulla echinocandica TaxID=2656787 RepID=A0A370U2L5_9HELO|nr:p-loop containing nucleoside triphosphate hydrolase [Venustampulla echinocandica]RDL42026.1 p-loop containing nucleoside triphosphate hydrolase [Venustampulla echinocandica]